MRKNLDIAPMPLISLSELPPPPLGKSGWPWTECCPFTEPTRSPCNDELQKISIVTPSFNQAGFIEETIRSVLLQGYRNLEYIIIDGNSSDESVEIIRKYERWITFWVSEPDRGQSHAINKGFMRASGHVLGWLNSDDFFLPGALQSIANSGKSNPDAVGWVGATQAIDLQGKPLFMLKPELPPIGENIIDWGGGRGAFLPQPSCFFSAQAFRDCRGLNEDLFFAMDLDLWLRLMELGRFVIGNQVLASYRVYPEAKSYRDEIGQLVELVQIVANAKRHEIARRWLERWLEMNIKRVNPPLSLEGEIIESGKMQTTSRRISARIFRGIRNTLRLGRITDTKNLFL